MVRKSILVCCDGEGMHVNLKTLNPLFSNEVTTFITSGLIVGEWSAHVPAILPPVSIGGWVIPRACRDIPKVRSSALAKNRT